MENLRHKLVLSRACHLVSQVLPLLEDLGALILRAIQVTYLERFWVLVDQIMP
jgi:hypothetical protein